MEVELKPELSTQNPDHAPAVAARGDYMEQSLVDTDIDGALDGVRDNADEYDREQALQTLHERLIRRGHFGPYEHATAFFAVEGVSVACERQLTRHRHMSFDVQSMRYVNFEDATPVVPPGFDDQFPGDVRADAVLENEYSDASDTYEHFVDDGIEQEDARFLLPLATKVNLTFSANSRALMHFIDMRHAGNAQWEIRELAATVLEACKDWAPVTFETYEAHAKGASKKAP